MPHASHGINPLVGVIDIGSNSVRLVIYDRLKRVPRPIFNEKASCGLGHGIHFTGKLDPRAKAHAHDTIERYAYLCRTMGIEKLYSVATAAIRDAADGPEFIRELSQQLGITIEIITGEREAQLAAQGVLSSIYQPEGIAGDLGGGSLELVSIRHQHVQHQATFQAGSLRLIDSCGGDLALMRKQIKEMLKDVHWLKHARRSFFAIGGGFRSIAQVHMRQQKYPVRILHQYTVPAETLYPFFSYLLTLNPKEVDQLKGLASKRNESFLPSVVVLEEILKQMDPEEVVFSAAGIREGLIYEKLPPQEYLRDALTASISALTGRDMDSDPYSNSLLRWQEQLITQESAEEKRLRVAACQLSDIALAVSPDFRAEWVFEHILVASLYGLDHRERVMLALAAYFRHKNKCKMESPALNLLREEDWVWAKLVGQLCGIGFHLSAGVGEILDHITLEVKGADITIHSEEKVRRILPEEATKRLEGLGDTCKAYRRRFT